MPIGLAMAEGVGYHSGHPGVLQPNWPESGPIGLAVKHQEGSARGCGRGDCR
jgi:hypothetical protein